MLLVLAGFIAPLSSSGMAPLKDPPVIDTRFISAEDNLSFIETVGSPSFRYSLSRGFELVLVKLGLFGWVTVCYDFFLFSFDWNLSWAFLNYSLVTSSLVLGLKL